MSKRLKIELGLGAVVTAVIVYYSVQALKTLQPGALLQADINWGLVAFSVIVYIYANYVRGLAFPYGIDRNMGRLTAFQVMGIGHAANMVLPLHAGEGLRIVFFPEDYSVIKRTKLMLISAVADVVAILIIALLSVPFSGFTDPAVLRVLHILSLCCLAGMVLFGASLLIVPQLRKYAGDYMSLAMVKMMIWVILSWLFLLVSVWLGLMAFGFPLIPSLRMSLAVFAVTNIINFIPASPGAIGLFEYGTILALGGLGIDQNTALAASLLLHLIQYAALLPMGGVLYFMALHGKYGEAIRQLRRRGRQ